MKNIMKIGRNEKCPCGSGKKYKRCCLGKTADQIYFETVIKSSDNLRNDSRIYQCLHPDKGHCDGKIIKAHAIQNNRILKRISENGEVITMDGQSNLIFQDAQKKGRKIATTFTGFCKYHDKTTFQEIEDKPFEASEKQIFLFTYRTMAWHVQKKREQSKGSQLMLKRMNEKGYYFSADNPVMEFNKSFCSGLADNDEEINEFNDALMSENYAEVHSYVWEIPYEVSFAISMMHEITYDLKGNRINDLSKPDRPNKIYLNVFPAEGKSYCIWSWLKRNDRAFLAFVEQFSLLSEKEKKNYFNNYLPRWSDSLIISPRLWNLWGKQVQEGFIAHANFDMIYSMLEEESNELAFQYMDTPWDLFESIECEVEV